MKALIDYEARMRYISKNSKWIEARVKMNCVSYRAYMIFKIALLKDAIKSKMHKVYS